MVCWFWGGGILGLYSTLTQEVKVIWGGEPDLDLRWLFLRGLAGSRTWVTSGLPGPATSGPHGSKVDKEDDKSCFFRLSDP